MHRIRENDEVVVMAGKNKGHRGKVLRVLNDRVLVEGANRAKKAVRPNPQKNEKGGLVSQEMSIHESNLMLYNPATQKGDRISYKRMQDGKKLRCFKSNGKPVDQK